MRELFEHWGIELDDEAFARAVAARLVEIGYTATVWRWHRDGWAAVRRTWAASPRAAAELAAGWPAFAREHPDFRVVAPDVERARDDDARFASEVLYWLGRVDPAVGCWIANTARGRMRVREWGWPLRIGIVPGFGGEEIADQTGYREFLHVEEARPGHASWDILVVPGTLREAMAALTARGASTKTARCVMITGRVDDVPSAALGPTLAAVRGLTGAHAVIVAGRAETRARAEARRSVAALLTSMAHELAHDDSVDSAIFRAARLDDPSAMPLLSGDLAFFDSTRPSLRLRRIADKLISAADAVEAELPPLAALPGMEEVDRAAPGARKARRMGRALKRHADKVDWDMERRGATGAAVLARAMAPALEAAAEASPPRFLQAGAREVQGDAETPSWAPHLTSNSTYALHVWIGAIRREAGVLVLPDEFPKLPDEHDTHELQVVLSEPDLLGAPMVATLRLPPVGDTEPCRFVIHCRPGVERIEARVIVLHRGRVLQTGVVRGAIVPAGARPGAADLLRFERDAAPRRRLATLGARSEFGAAIVTDEGDERSPSLGIVGRRVARIKLGDATLQAITDRFNAAISDIAADPQKFATLRADGTVALLRDLAAHGAMLHETIYKHNEVGPGLANEPRLQIVTARADGFLPLELAYRFEAPDDDAVLCEGAEDALGADAAAAGEPGACAARCGPSPGGTDKRVCPMGFWCLSKTIERFAHRAEAIDETADFSVLAEAIGARPTIPRPASGLVAASDRATAHDAAAVQRVLELLQSGFGGGAKLVGDWDAWTTGITESHPGLLVVIPHHLREAGHSLLQIGAGSTLKSTLVKRKHVVGEPPPEPPARPVVMLLGCETQDAAIALERFPAVFLERGAAVVVATIATVLGRDAAPAAEALIALLAEQPAEERSFGDLLLATRRKLLLQGKPMGLALAGFGDADWRLA